MRIITTGKKSIRKLLYALPICSILLSAAMLGGCTSDSKSKLVATDLSMERVEELTEAAAHDLIDFSNAVRLRDFSKASKYLVADFKGDSLQLEEKQTSELGGGLVKKTYSIQVNTKLKLAEFMQSLQQELAPFEQIDLVFLKPKGATFKDPGKGKEQIRGFLKCQFSLQGKLAGGKPIAIRYKLQAECVHQEGLWKLTSFKIKSKTSTTRSHALFNEVATEAGLAKRTPDLRTQKAPNFYWQGCSVADVNNDSHQDIFVGASPRSLLYVNNANGSFTEVGEQLGLSQESATTSALFFDADQDGDLDLFCAHVGWELDGVPEGQALSYYQNDGNGKFTDKSIESGLDLYHIAFSSAAADVDNDGDLDLFVCGYNRLDSYYPNHWFAATNGTRNLFFENQGDGTFKELGLERGFSDLSWTYACAFADFDEDGDQDLYVANDYGPNQLWVNDGKGNFSDQAKALGVLDIGNGMGASWGDLNQDSYLDLYVSNMSSSAGNRILSRLMKADDNELSSTLYKGAAGNSIFHYNPKSKSFDFLSPSKGGIGASWAWSVGLLDINLDGLLDAYVANGFISGVDLKDT